MNSSICALGGTHQKNFEMRNFKKILLKIENVEKMHQKILKFFYISKKNEIQNTLSSILKKKLNCGLFEKFVINFSSQISMLNALNIFFTHFYMHVSKRKLNMWLEFSYINVLYKLCCNPDQKHFFVLMKD